MIKSIVSGGVVLVAVMVIVLGLVGAYALSDAALLSWGAVGLIATILFASFGGFKPFFRVLESGRGLNQADSDRSHGIDAHQDPAAAAAIETPSTTGRRLISVGADPESQPARPLFEERPPTEALSDESEHPDESTPPERPPRRPLFGEALAERLAEERRSADDTDVATVEIERDLEPEDSPVEAAAIETEESPTEPEVVEAVSGDGEQPGGDGPPGSQIVVDTDPDWVSREPEARDGDELITADEEDAGDERDTALDETALGDEDSDVELADHAAKVETDDETGEVETGEKTDGETAEPRASEDDADADPAAVAPAHVEETTDLPVVLTRPAAVELHKYSADEVMAIVRAQEGDLVESLIDEGLLTTAGPITDRDVRTMIFVAVSSSELIDVLTGARDGEVPLSPTDPAELTAGATED